jgi:hypothetical protein
VCVRLRVRESVRVGVRVRARERERVRVRESAWGSVYESEEWESAYLHKSVHVRAPRKSSAFESACLLASGSSST